MRCSPFLQRQGFRSIDTMSYACRLSLDIWCDGPSEKKILAFLDPCMFSHNLLHEPSCMSRVDLSCLRLSARLKVNAAENDAGLAAQ